LFEKQTEEKFEMFITLDINTSGKVIGQFHTGLEDNLVGETALNAVSELEQAGWVFHSMPVKNLTDAYSHTLVFTREPDGRNDAANAQAERGDIAKRRANWKRPGSNVTLGSHMDDEEDRSSGGGEEEDE
jgi:hypothetical protein